MSAGSVSTSHSLHQLLENESRNRPDAHKTVPTGIFAHEKPSETAASRVCTFFGHDSIRFAFELPMGSGSELAPALIAGRDLSRPLRAVSEFRTALLSKMKASGRKSSTASGEEVADHMRSLVREIADVEPTSAAWLETAADVIRGQIRPEGRYDAESVDRLLRERLDDVIARVSGYKTIFRILSEMSELRQILAAPEGARIAFQKRVVSPRDMRLDELFMPVISFGASTGLVELSFRYTPDDATRKFLSEARTAIIGNKKKGRIAKL